MVDGLSTSVDVCKGDHFGENELGAETTEDCKREHSKQNCESFIIIETAFLC
jgi:hypothetical protein